MTNQKIAMRSEEHTSELQSRSDLVCRLLLEKKKHTSELQSRSDLVCRLLLEKKKNAANKSPSSGVETVAYPLHRELSIITNYKLLISIAVSYHRQACFCVHCCHLSSFTHT